MSSSKILNCNLHGPAASCIGALHTYTWNPSETACTFRIMREVQGIHTPQYFVADKGQLFYKFKGFQNLPIPCRGHKVYLTNEKDILLLREDKNTEVKLLDIRPQDVANTTELRSLRKEISAWAKMSCQSSARELADSQPHHLATEHLS